MRPLMERLREQIDYDAQYGVSEAMLTEVAAEVERLQARVQTLEAALTEIRDMDFVDSALDNRWASRIARAALAAEKGEGDDDGA